VTNLRNLSQKLWDSAAKKAEDMLKVLKRLRRTQSISFNGLPSLGVMDRFARDQNWNHCAEVRSTLKQFLHKMGLGLRHSDRFLQLMLKEFIGKHDWESAVQ